MSIAKSISLIRDSSSRLRISHTVLYLSIVNIFSGVSILVFWLVWRWFLIRIGRERKFSWEIFIQTWSSVISTVGQLSSNFSVARKHRLSSRHNILLIRILWRSSKAKVLWNVDLSFLIRIVVMMRWNYSPILSSKGSRNRIIIPKWFSSIIKSCFLEVWTFLQIQWTKTEKSESFFLTRPSSKNFWVSLKKIDNLVNNKRPRLTSHARGGNYLSPPRRGI